MLFLHNVKLFRVSNKVLKSAISMRNISDSSNENDAFKNHHIFKKLWTKPELIQYITNNVHYEDDNFVVFNKPYGVFSRVNNAMLEPRVDEPASCSHTVTDILPDLSARFESENLSILLNPERCFSGVTILSKGKDSKNNILHNFSDINECNRVYTFLTIVLGHPPTSLEDRFRIYHNKEERRYEIMTGKKRHEKGLKIWYRHEVVDQSKAASLVKVDLNYNYLHCLRLVLATKCLSPVLGDFVYSPRVTTLFDVPLLAPPKNQSTPKILHPEVLRALRLTPEDADCCPCHIHLQCTTFRLKEKKFIVSVPPPEHFVWSGLRLGLEEVTSFSRGVEDCGERKREDVQNQ